MNQPIERGDPSASRAVEIYRPAEPIQPFPFTLCRYEDLSPSARAQVGLKQHELYIVSLGSKSELLRNPEAALEIRTAIEDDKYLIDWGESHQVKLSRAFDKELERIYGSREIGDIPGVANYLRERKYDSEGKKALSGFWSMRGIQTPQIDPLLYRYEQASQGNFGISPFLDMRGNEELRELNTQLAALKSQPGLIFHGTRRIIGLKFFTEAQVEEGWREYENGARQTPGDLGEWKLFPEPGSLHQLLSGQTWLDIADIAMVLPPVNIIHERGLKPDQAEYRELFTDLEQQLYRQLRDKLDLYILSGGTDVSVFSLRSLRFTILGRNYTFQELIDNYVKSETSRIDEDERVTSSFTSGREEYRKETELKRERLGLIISIIQNWEELASGQREQLLALPAPDVSAAMQAGQEIAVMVREVDQVEPIAVLNLVREAAQDPNLSAASDFDQSAISQMASLHDEYDNLKKAFGTNSLHVRKRLELHPEVVDQIVQRSMGIIEKVLKGEFFDAVRPTGGFTLEWFRSREFPKQAELVIKRLRALRVAMHPDKLRENELLKDNLYLQAQITDAGPVIDEIRHFLMSAKDMHPRLKRNQI